MAAIKKHILIISEDPGFRFMVSLALMWDGYLTSEAGGEEEAVRLIAFYQGTSHPVDLLFAGLKDRHNYFALIAGLKKSRISLPVLSSSGFFYAFGNCFSGLFPAPFGRPLSVGKLIKQVDGFLRKKEVRNHGAGF